MPFTSTPIRPIFHHVEQVMGTVVVLDLYLNDTVERGLVKLHLIEALRILHDADAVFSTWQATSALSQLRSGSLTLDQVPTEITDVLAQCAMARTLSEGWFDPWAMPGGVDPTGYVKGWAAQRALAALNDVGVIGALVNAAGDIATCGVPYENTVFRIGVTDPFAPHHLACEVDIDGAIATSGTYERGQHLIDPWTGQHRARVASASVTGPDLGLADALATALAVAGREFLDVIEALYDYEGFVIERDGLWNFTTGFPFSSDSSSTKRYPSEI
jgi:thiamine biosynthesis lipoprotein